MSLDRIIAGDTYRPAQATVLPAYPATDGWSLKYRLVPLAGGAGAPITINCVASGADHQPQETAANTAAWAPGEYAWTSYVTRGAESFTLERGRVVIEPDPRTSATVADVSGFEPVVVAPTSITLAVAQEQLAAWLAASLAVAQGQRYAIGNRELVRADAAEIRAQITTWQGHVNRLTAEASGRAPGPLGRVLYGVPRP